MSNQDKNIIRDPFQNRILDLEQKYMKIIENIIDSNDFKNDLLSIEREVKTNYGDYSEKFDTTDKINIMAERLITHHIYMKLYTQIKSIYPSPISSDVGIRLEDCILCVDAKTINVNSNRIDINSTQVEQNQNSFNNKNYLGIKTKSNLKMIDYYHENELPVLSYIVKIIYFDDKHSFKLNKDNEIPTVVIACIPNGKLSNLFNYNIVQNFKTYEYYNENDNEKFRPIYIPDNLTKEEVDIIIQSKTKEKGLQPAEYNNRKVYIDISSQIMWWETSYNNQKCLRPVKSGSNMRVRNEALKNRFNSFNEYWALHFSQ